MNILQFGRWLTSKRWQIRSDPHPKSLLAGLDYGGFNILSQLRRQAPERIQPYRMGIANLEAHVHFAYPLTHTDERNPKHLLSRPE